ncbi:etoposide-induced protein 2.4-domain-containing protein [Halteromyces radiatus]|uniref:etoposide-induced protein 2.4-domain-containing protein n=1 Tax=Halteromyces radiatus TaxID=101107 RepID=UPI00221F551E|nr:etoposide-induced protein 2.4-domain-containing protein [Halteromyces radiatus]KAI8079721.1 etoposide-induced protein 2.4-domain-containing protein [Halteromyces radiatus]
MAKQTTQLQRTGTSSLYASNFYTRPLDLYQPTMAATLKLFVFYGNCTLLVNLLRRIPYIGVILGFMMNSIVMAYYSFEYKWIELGWTQEHRLSFVEQHWAYFLGFGIPASLFTFFLSSLRSGAMFAFTFPIFIMMASIATTTPSMNDNQYQYNHKRIPILFGLRALNKLALSIIQVTHIKLFDRLMDQSKKDSLGKLV